MELTIDESIARLLPGCRLGYLLLQGLTIQGTNPALNREFCELQRAAAERYNLADLSQVPRIAGVRSMYKKMSWEPARYRPAAEALVRRILQRKELYYVNSAVDASNYCSIQFLLPFGLYDADKLSGNICYRVAGDGEYENIGGRIVGTDGKPFLTDALGVFGNPTSDARRTAVTLATKNVLSVVYVDEELPTAELTEILRCTAEKLQMYNGGELIRTGIVTV